MKPDIQQSGPQRIASALLEDEEDFDLVGEIQNLPDALPIHDEARLTPTQKRYWSKFASSEWNRRLYDLVDPWRTRVTELRQLYPKGTAVYQASTSGPHGKSSRRVIL